MIILTNLQPSQAWDILAIFPQKSWAYILVNAALNNRLESL